jgi:hypothetical protein
MRRRLRTTLLAGTPLTLAAAVWLSGAPAGARRPASEPLPPRLSATGLYRTGQPGTVRPEHLSFAPQYPLWTDGATKRRWVSLPSGRAVDASDPDVWVFPVGTRFWKEFSFGGRLVETRLIERLPGGSWRYATYLWDDDQVDAELAPARGLPGGVEVRPGLRHAIPGEADCRACHEGRPTPVLGFGALQLSPDRDPGAPHAEPAPPGALDLRALVARGLVRGLPREMLERPPRVAAPTATARAALGYLHANCGACHNGDGPLAPLGLSLWQSVGRPDGAAAVLVSLVAPSRFRVPGRDDMFRVVPGAPELSALTYRMGTRTPTMQMPPLGTALVDEVGLALVQRWIRETNDRKEKRP